jgi:hypothetical protein
MAMVGFLTSLHVQVSESTSIQSSGSGGLPCPPISAPMDSVLERFSPCDNVTQAWPSPTH